MSLYNDLHSLVCTRFYLNYVTVCIDEILAEYMVKKEPQKFSIKGNFILLIDGKELDFSVLPEGIELDSNSLKRIDYIKIVEQKFMTIENRTSYLRYVADDTVTFYLGGYPNRFQRDFIKKVHLDNPDMEFLHFGDIDVAGRIKNMIQERCYRE